MTKKAGLVGTFSNHSGKRSCVTTLFQKLQNNVASHEIKVRTGNRSTVGVETYISASTEQQIETSRALEPPWSKAAKMPVCATVSVPPVIKLEPAATISMPDASPLTPSFSMLIFSLPHKLLLQSVHLQKYYLQGFSIIAQLISQCPKHSNNF